MSTSLCTNSFMFIPNVQGQSDPLMLSFRACKVSPAQGVMSLPHTVNVNYCINLYLLCRPCTCFKHYSATLFCFVKCRHGCLGELSTWFWTGPWRTAYNMLLIRYKYVPMTWINQKHCDFPQYPLSPLKTVVYWPSPSCRATLWRQNDVDLAGATGFGPVVPCRAPFFYMFYFIVWCRPIFFR